MRGEVGQHRGAAGTRGAAITTSRGCRGDAAALERLLRAAVVALLLVVMSAFDVAPLWRGEARGATPGERGLVAHWKFDETSGTKAADSSGNGNDGTNGGAAVGRPGKVGTAYGFDGKKAHVLVRDYRKPTTTATYAAWVWADSAPAGGGASIFKNWGGLESGQVFFGLWSGKLSVCFKQADDTATDDVKDPDAFPLASWQHVAAVADGRAVRLYRNALEVAVAPCGGRLKTSFKALGIGVKPGDDGTGPDTGHPEYWHGRIDEARIYDRALSAEEVRALFEGRAVGRGKPTAPAITSTPPAKAHQGLYYSYALGGTGNPPPTFGVSGLPLSGWLEWDEARAELSGRPGPGDVGRAGRITVTATNSEGSARQEFAITVVKTGAWVDTFDGKRLSGEWTVDRSRESGGALRLERGRLIVTAEENRYHHIERRLGFDGSDAAPLVAEAQIAADYHRGMQALMALYWDERNVIAVGPAGEGGDRKKAQALWVVGDERPARHATESLGERDTAGHYRIVLTTRDVTAYASQDGLHYFPVVSFERGPGRFNGPPALLIVGRGWAGERERNPDLDNDTGGSRRDLHTCTIDAVRVSKGVPATEASPPRGYDKRDSWEETLEAYRARGIVRKWWFLGPFRQSRDPVGPENKVDLRQKFKLEDGKQGGWISHTVEEDEPDAMSARKAVRRAVDRQAIVDLGQTLKTRRHDSVGFAYAEILADEPTDERLYFDGEHLIEAFVNGRRVGSFQKHGEGHIRLGRLGATVNLTKGRNRLVLKVTKRRTTWRFAFRHGPGDLRDRVRLLRQLMADFPEETERASRARFELARAWERMGYAREATRVLAEVTADPRATPDDVADAYFGRVRLHRLLRDGKAAAADLRALAERLPEGTPERNEVTLEALSSLLRAGQERAVEEAVAEIERESERRYGSTDMLSRVHGALAGIYEERGDFEGRMAHLRKMTVVEGAPARDLDAIHVEYAEALLAAPEDRGGTPPRVVYAKGERPEGAVLEEALEHYRRAIDLVSAPGRASPRPRGALLPNEPDAARPLIEEADRALDRKEYARALELLPAIYLRSVLLESAAGGKMLGGAIGGLSGFELPPPPPRGGPASRDWRRVSEGLKKRLVASGPVTGWHVVGPFDNTDWKAYSDQIVSPARVDVGAKVRGKSWNVPGREHYAGGYLNLARLYGKDNVVAYLYKEVEAERDYDAELKMGADDGLTFWFNGKKLHEDRTQRGVNPDEIKLRVRFKKGTNRLLARVQQGSGDWAFVLRIWRGTSAPPDMVRLLYLLEHYPEARAGVASLFADHAHQLFREGRYDEAAALARTLTRTFPDCPELQVLTALRFVDYGLDRGRDPGGAAEFAEWALRYARRRALPNERRYVWDFRTRYAKALQALGDLEGAAKGLQGIVRSEPRGEAAARAILELAELHRAAGYPRVAERYYREVLDRPVGDRDLRAQAYTALGEVRRVRGVRPVFDVSFDVGTILRTADRAAARKDFERALRGYQLAIDRYAGRLFRLSPDKFVGVAEYCADRIRTTGREGVAVYRRLFDKRAGGMFMRALAARDAALLEEVAQRYPYTSYGDDALNQAGNLYLDRGRAARARDAFGRILAEHPGGGIDRAMLLAKYAFAAELAGNLERARRVLEVLGRDFGEQELTIGGRTVRAESYAEAERERLFRKGEGPRGWATVGASPRREGRTPAAPRPGPRRFETHFPGSRFSRTGARPPVPGVCRSVSEHAAVAGDTAFFHTLDEAFAIDLGSGRLRWRSRRAGFAFERLLSHAGSRKSETYLKETMTTVQGGYVYLRAQRRSLALLRDMGDRHARRARERRQAKLGRSSGDSFIIEAREAATGRLRWSTEMCPELWGLTAVSSPAAVGGTVYAVFQEPGENQRLRAAALDGRKGSVLWTSEIGFGFVGVSFTDQKNIYLGDHGAAPSVADGELYISTDMGAVAALNAATGNIRWVARYQRALLDQRRSGRVRDILLARAASRVIVGPRYLYVAPRDALALLAVRRSNGDIRWRKRLVDCQTLLGLAAGDGAVPGPARPAPAGTDRWAGDADPDDGRLVIQGSGVTCLDGASGRECWRWRPERADGVIFGVGAIGGPFVYVATENGLHRLRISDGRKDTSEPWKALSVEGGPVGNLIVLEDAILGLGRGRIVALDAAPGAFASGGREVHLPGVPVRELPLATVGLPPAKFAPPVVMRWHLGDEPGDILEAPGARPQEMYFRLGDGVARADLAGSRAAGGAVKRPTIVWRTTLDPRVRSFVFSKDLVLALYEKYVSAIDRTTGRSLWTYAAEHRAGVTAAAGVVCVRGRERDRVYLLGARTGKPKTTVMIPRQSLFAVPAGGSVVTVATERDKVWAVGTDPGAGSEVWRHDFSMGTARDLKWTLSPDMREVFLCNRERVIRFDLAARKEIFNEKINLGQQIHMWFEGGYLILYGKQNRRDWFANALDPKTGKVLFKARDEHGRGGKGYYRFVPGRVLCFTKAQANYVIACRGVPGGKELWKTEAPGAHDHLYRGVAAGRYWVQPLRRRNGLCCFLLDMAEGKVVGEFELPGTPDHRELPVVFKEGALIYAAKQGVFAVGGPPPTLAAVSLPTDGPVPLGGLPKWGGPIRAVARYVRRAASSRPLDEREGSSEFLATYAPDRHRALLASGSMRIDGRLDDWARRAAIDIADPLHVRAQPGAEQWAGPDDLSARLGVAWDGARVYFAVAVKDDLHVAPAPGASLTTGDSLLIGIDPGGEGGEELDGDDLLLQGALVDGRSRLVQLHGRDVFVTENDERPTFRAARTADGFVYELALPRSALAHFAERPKIGLALAVIDRDGRKPGGALEWGCGLLRGLRPRLFGKVSFVDLHGMSPPQGFGPGHVTGEPCKIVIRNRLKRPVTVWWVDFGGVLRKYHDLDPGETVLQNSYDGHRWQALVEGETVSTYIAYAARPEWDVVEKSDVDRQGARGSPIVRVGFKEGDHPPATLHGKIVRADDGSYDLGDGAPWKWISVGEGPMRALEGLRSFTVLGWANPTSLSIGPGGNRLVFNLNYNRSGFDLICAQDGRLRLAVNEWPDAVRNDSSPGKLRVGKWTFFAVTYDSTRLTANVRWYFGDAEAPAELDRTASYSRGPTDIGSGPLTVGNYNTTVHRHGTNRQFRGSLRGMEIFGSRLGATAALSRAAIRKRQKAGAAP